VLALKLLLLFICNTAESCATKGDADGDAVSQDEVVPVVIILILRRRDVESDIVGLMRPTIHGSRRGKGGES